MPKLAANLSMMYTDLPFLERFGAAAKDGFKGVEYLFPYAFAAQDIAAKLHEHQLEQVLFNVGQGDFDAGERGISAVPGREQEFHDALEIGITYAKATRCPRLHIMAGLVKNQGFRAAMHTTYVNNLRHAAKRLGEEGIGALIEPINPRDIPGYFLNTQAQGHEVVAQVGSQHLKVQMDFYHVQIVEGDIAMRLRHHFAGVGHVQIAGVPARNEPDLGEVNFPYLLNLLDELGYAGWVGCEYRPKLTSTGGTSAGLSWAKPWLGAR
jgi:2-dehydrotetronate isomerase